MPITYTIDLKERFITETWTGEITADHLASYWQRYLTDPDVMAIRRTLADLRAAQILFDGIELRALVQNVAKPVLAGRDWKTALVVAKPRQFGVSRQYQVFAESYSKDAIFHDPETALLWLLSPEATPDPAQ